MKSKGKFRAVSVALVAGAAIMLSGCGSTIAASSQRANQHVTKRDGTAANRQNTKIPWEHGAILYQTYVNQGYFFSVKYPKGWIISPRPVNGRGRSFTAPSGLQSYTNGNFFSNDPRQLHDVGLFAEAGANAVSGVGRGYTFTQMYREALRVERAYEKLPGMQRVSLTTHDGWIQMIYSQRVGSHAIEYNLGTWNLYYVAGVSVVFPAAESKVYWPIAKHIVDSFRASKMASGKRPQG